MKKLSSLLKKDGQIIAIIKNVSSKKYVAVKLRPVWENKAGPKFGWIHFNLNFLSELCSQAGLRLKAIQGNQYSYLVKIVKKITVEKATDRQKKNES